MGRGVSAGGGQSSLGYLFGGGEAPAAQSHEKASSSPAPKPLAAAAPQPADHSKQVAAGILSSNANNYVRGDGQNCGNFLTERRSTKVQAAPGGGSSLGYLFGGGSGN
ncbi:protein SPIRAL1-like 3 [Ipomoea triloba]|uniref:protein SPIRAL1-like 3 n=1 Tax=Ipomoea triloba TaxID=35885 RepID=UPI00125D6A5B|nr:protein SPIRAL1-like 3 [Ipomoea triloba]GLL18760.1 protein SPIRAL1-like 3 [Ipomoea trifida]